MSAFYSSFVEHFNLLYRLNKRKCILWIGVTGIVQNGDGGQLFKTSCISGDLLLLAKCFIYLFIYLFIN